MIYIDTKQENVSAVDIQKLGMKFTLPFQNEYFETTVTCSMYLLLATPPAKIISYKCLKSVFNMKLKFQVRRASGKHMSLKSRTFMR